MNKTVPIVVVNWNGLEDTLKCIETVLAQEYTDWLLCLADNGSDNNEGSILKEKYDGDDRFRLFLFDENLGFTKAHNRIVESLLSDGNEYHYIAFLNNDAFASPQWLKALLTTAKEVEAGMVTSKMVNYFNPKVMDNAGHLLLNTAEVIPLGHAEPTEDYTEVFENVGACAGAVLYDVNMIRDIGMFDEYFETGYEDAEYGMRANVLGYKSVFCPGAVVHHKVSTSIKKIMDYEYLLKIQLNIFYSYFKLMPMGVILLNLPFMFFKYGSVLLIDVLFFRKDFLKIMLDAIYRTAISERKVIVKSRNAFYAKHEAISTYSILKKMTFFLWFDIKRFWKYVILRKKSEFLRDEAID